jgi:uncharacterized protein HemX
LEAVKVALLTGNQAFFQDSLHSAIIWCEQYFAVSSPEVQGFLAQLKALSGATIAPPLPDISGSLLALQEQRAQLNQGGAE